MVAVPFCESVLVQTLKLKMEVSLGFETIRVRNPNKSFSECSLAKCMC